MTDARTAMFTTPEMTDLFSGASLVRRMLEVESALARALARAGAIPPDAAEAIADACRIERIDVEALFRDAARSGTPVVPLVSAIGRLVDSDTRRFVHWGATSQDVIDTAVVLQVRDALVLLSARLLDVGAACESLAERHRRTGMAGRTLLQQAVPITFGLKAARWVGLATRAVERLRAVGNGALALQFGGAAGTLASLGGHGLRVAELLGEELALAVPDLPWHAERDRIAEIAAAVGIGAGAAAKIATDLALLSQTEVGEACAGADAGGRSSAMPHKRNPVSAMEALASARLALAQVPVLFGAMAQEHERAIGAWQAEWEALPALFRYTAGAVDRVRAAVSDLRVDAERMGDNMRLFGGLVMAEALTAALSARVGRDAAYRMVEAASARAIERGVSLREAASGDPGIRDALGPADLAAAFDPLAYLGASDAFIDRALKHFRAVAHTDGAG
jgi:3-carboxy-cis,cis-muconate cycloisomerase